MEVPSSATFDIALAEVLKEGLVEWVLLPWDSYGRRTNFWKEHSMVGTSQDIQPKMDELLD